jgi:hypothetical protein
MRKTIKITMIVIICLVVVGFTLHTLVNNLDLVGTLKRLHGG